MTDVLTRAATSAVPLSVRSRWVLGVASLAGLMMLCWPLLVQVEDGDQVVRRSCSCCSCPW